MDKHRIIIVTGTGGALGTGHMQRMLNIASYMNSKGSFDIKIITAAGDYTVPGEFKPMISGPFPAKADLVIRDMRDSTKNQITALSKIAPVLAVDDAGEGKTVAAHSINLLPLPSEETSGISFDTGKFLYGYNFIHGIESIRQDENIQRDIDIAIYAGFSPPDYLLPLIEKSIPDNTRTVLFSSGKPILLTGNPLPENITYAEILTRTKIVMTHFGITMFEADICGCKIAALNPTPYHRALTSSVARKMQIIHSAEYDTFDPVLMSDDLMSSLKRNSDINLSVNNILEKINSGRENFTQYIYKIIM